MESTSVKPDYPPRLFLLGKAHIQNHSLNYNSYFSKIGNIKDGVGDDVMEYLKDSAVGVFVKMACMPYIFSSKLVHHFISNQLATPMLHEIWALIADEPIRFSLHEFAELTGMNCDPLGGDENWDVDHTDFWTELGVESPLLGPSWDELTNILERCATWSFIRRKQVGLLCVLAIAVFGIHSGSRIPLKAAKRVLDFEAFERYPWGRVACDSLVTGVKLLTFQNNSYHVKGFVQALHIWAFESVVGFGEKFGRRRDGVGNVVPLLRWAGSKKHFNFEAFMNEELGKHGKIRVRNCVIKPDDQIFPQWDEDVADSRVAHLLQDLLHDKYIPTFYTEEPNKKGRKRKPEAKSGTGDKKIKEANVTLDEGSGSGNPIDLVDMAKVGLSKMLIDFGDRFGSLEENIKSVIQSSVDALEAKFETRQDATVADLRSRIEQLETVVHGMRKTDPQPQVREIDAHEKTDMKKAESSSKTPSWIVSNVKYSGDQCHIACATKKTSLLSKGMPKEPIETEVSSKERVLPKQKVVKSVPIVKKSKKDIKKEVVVPEVPKKDKEKTKIDFQDGLSDSEGFSDAELRRKSKLVETFAGGMMVSLRELRETNQFKEKKRPMRLSKTQIHPFVGNSTVKRLIPEAGIDPLTYVEEDKLENLLTFIQENESKPIGRNRGMKYLRLMTPKKNWPPKEQDYGWLHDGHMDDIMKMFTLRSVAEDSPYHSPRIAFLDSNFVRSWVRDLPPFDPNPKNFKFSQGYISMFNGNYYDTVKTNWKWFIDVDHLYITHHIRDNHWAALDINVKEERIDVYDRIPSLTRNNEVTQSCRPFARMIPHLLNQEVPSSIQKKRVAMFTVNRVKDLPRNIDIGDCGVYAVKFIEHLAMGKGFEELCDANMAAYRLKLACDIFHEVPIPTTFDIPELIDEDLEILDENPFE